MATRFNTRLFLILTISLFSAVGVIGGLWYLQTRGDATRSIRIGDEYFAQGDMDRAKRYYRRAIDRDRSNVQYVDKLEEAILSYRPVNQNEAFRWYQEYLGSVLRYRTTHFALNDDALQAYLAELHQIARRSNMPAFWRQLQDESAEMLNRVGPDHPLAPVFTLQFAFASIRLGQDTLTLGELQELERQVEKTAVQMSDDDQAQAIRISSKIILYRRLMQSGQVNNARVMLSDFNQLIEDVELAIPEGLDTTRAIIVAVELIRVLDDLEFRSVYAAKQPGRVEKLKNLLSESSDLPPWLMRDCTAVLGSLPHLVDREWLFDLQRNYLDTHQDESDIRLNLAQQLYGAGDEEGATAEGKIILEAEPLGVGYPCLIQDQNRAYAASLLGDIEFQRWEQADPDVASQHLQSMAAIREQLAQLVDDASSEPLMIRMDGAIAYAREDYDQAVRYFESLIQQHGIRDIQTFYLVSRSLEKINQLGLAHERIASASEMQPTNLSLMQEKARLEIRIGHYDAALATAQQILSLDAEHEIALGIVESINRTQMTVLGGPRDVMNTVISQATAALDRNEFDLARSLVNEPLLTAPEDRRLRSMLASIEARSGNVDKAVALIDKMLDETPDDRSLLSWKVALGSTSTVQAIQRFVELTHESELDRARAELASFSSLITKHETIRDFAKRNGDVEQIQETEALMSEVFAAAEAPLQVLIEANPESGVVFDFQFLTALIDQEIDEIERLLPEARRLDLDGLGGLTYQARYELVTKRYAEAISTLKEVTRLKHYNANYWQLLGYASEQFGDSNDALRAYARAYDCNPANLGIARRYAMMLSLDGQMTMALPILRNAYNLTRNNTSLREEWLALEEEVGFKSTVLRHRLQIYQNTPTDLINTGGLARLYGYLQPTRLLLLDAQGHELFSSIIWQQLNASEIRTINLQAIQTWRQQSDLLLEELAEYGMNSFDVAYLRSIILRGRAEYQNSILQLKEFIDQKPLKDYTVAQVLKYARFLIGMSEEALAVETLLEIRNEQNPNALEVDVVLGQLFLSRREFEKAIPFLISQTKALQEISPHIQLLTCYINLERFEDAEQYLQNLASSSELNAFQELMLRASLADRMAHARFAEQDRAGARELLIQSRDALNRAQDLSPEDSKPHVQLARSLFGEYTFTNESELLINAMTALDRAQRFDPTSSDIRQLRVEIALARGELAVAINSLRDVLREEPNNIRARRQLIQLRLNSGNHQEALLLAREAVQQAPNNAEWRVILGDLQTGVRQDYAEAAENYRLAFQFTANNEYLTKRLVALLSLKPPLIEDVLQEILDQDESVRSYPSIQTVYARALHGAGPSEEVWELLRESYRSYQAMIADNTLNQTAISFWMSQVNTLFSDEQLEQFEAFVMEASQGYPDVLTLRLLASHNYAHDNVASAEHAIELQVRALQMISDEDATLRSVMLTEYAAFAIQAERYQDSADAFEEVMGLMPENIAVLNNFAYLLADHLKRPDEALEHAVRAHEISPDHPDVLDTLGWVNFKLGRLDEAEKYLLQSINMHESASAHVHLAYILIEQGDLGGALDRLIRAERLQPNDGTRDEIDLLKADIQRRSAQAVESVPGN